MGTSLLGIPLLNDQTVWYKEILEEDLAKRTTLGPASVSISNPIIKQLFNEWGKGKWRGFFEHSTEVQCRAAGAQNKHTCYICGFPIRNNNGNAALGSQCEHIIACVQLILLCGLAGKEWDQSIDVILDTLGIDIPTKEAYKEWRKGIVGRAGETGATTNAEEGGGKIGIAYLYAHPACNALKDNDPFIRIKFNDNGTITILCTVDNYYAGGGGWEPGIQQVVPHNPDPTKPWDPRAHIPPPITEVGSFVPLQHSDTVPPENLGRIYSSICWKNIYWLLCSLVGYNLILKTQVRALTNVAAAEKTISEGGSKTVDWRKAVFAPWTGAAGAVSTWWQKDDALANHSSIFGSGQHPPPPAGLQAHKHPNGVGLGVYKQMPLMIDRVYSEFVSTEEWIQRRADRIGEHLKPLIKNIQTQTFQTNSKQFGLISALVFAHRLDKKIKNEKDKFEQDEIKKNRPYTKGILSIKFQSEMLNIMIATANTHNFTIASSVVSAAPQTAAAAQTAAAPQTASAAPLQGNVSGGWKGWLSSVLTTVATYGAAAVAAVATAASVTAVTAPAATEMDGGGDLQHGGSAGLQEMGQIFESALTTIKDQDMKTRSSAFRALVVFSNYGWIPDKSEVDNLSTIWAAVPGQEAKDLFEKINKKIASPGMFDMTTWASAFTALDTVIKNGIKNGWIPDESDIEILSKVTSLYESVLFPPEVVSSFEAIKDKLIADINKAAAFFSTNPDEVDKFYANFGRLYTYPNDGTPLTGLNVIVAPERGAGNFTQYITTTREQIMEEGLKVFVIESEWFQELKTQMLTPEMNKEFIDSFLFETYKFLDLNNEQSAFADNSKELSTEILKELSDRFIEYFPKYPEITSQAVSEVCGGMVVAYNNLLNSMIDVDERSLGERDPRLANDVISDMILISDLFNMNYESNGGDEIIMKLKAVEGIVIELKTALTVSVESGSPSPSERLPRTSSLVGWEAKGKISKLKPRRSKNARQKALDEAQRAATAKALTVLREEDKGFLARQHSIVGQSQKRPPSLYSAEVGDNLLSDEEGERSVKRIKPGPQVMPAIGVYGGGGGQSVRSKKKSKRKNKRKSGRKNRKSKYKKTIRRNNIRNNTRSKKRSQKRSQRRSQKRSQKRK